MEEVLKNKTRPEDIIFANPIKTSAQIEGARRLKVKKMTFDTEEELDKIHAVFPQAEVVLRIACTVSDAQYKLSEKYGAYIEDVPAMLKKAKQLNLKLIGVSFHTGSGGVSYKSYEGCLINARKVFDMAKQMGIKMNFLDIGGGFS